MLCVLCVLSVLCVQCVLSVLCVLCVGHCLLYQSVFDSHCVYVRCVCVAQSLSLFSRVFMFTTTDSFISFVLF